MLAKKKKISKKQIQEDKLVTFYSKALTYWAAYKNQIIIGVAVIAVIIAALVYFSTQSQKESLKASAELAKVAPVFTAGNYQAAIDGMPSNNVPSLKDIIDKYSGTEEAETAKMYLAESYYYTNQFDKALEYFEDYSGDNDLFKAAAFAGAAGCYEVKGDYEKAADLFEKAAHVSEINASNAQYLLNAGADYIKVGKYKEAKNVLDNIKEKHSNTAESREADKYLALVNQNL